MPRITPQQEDRLRRTLIAASFTLIFGAGFVAGGQWHTPMQAQGFSVTMECGAASASQTRTTLYFGRSRPREAVQAVIQSYRHAFDQQSVLRESARVCVAA